MWPQIIISLVMMVVSYVLTPKVKTSNSSTAQDMDNPTASAGSPLPVVFGTITIKSPNYLGYWAKEIREYED